MRNSCVIFGVDVTVIIFVSFVAIGWLVFMLATSGVRWS